VNPAWIIPDWPAPPNVRAVVSTRFGPGVSEPPFEAFNLGARCGDDPNAVSGNRQRLIESLSLPSPCWLRQVHGTDVVIFPPLPLAGEGEPARSADALNGIGCAAERPRQDAEGRVAWRAQDARGWQRPRAARTGEGNTCPALREPQADAAVARTFGVTLVILTADCLPVLFCNDDGSEIAAAHAGWRGLSAGVLENTVAAMRSARENIMVWLGPAIGPRSYEVGDEVRDAFLAHDPQAEAAFAATRPGHWHCDLYALARQRLRGAGIERIFGGGFDTFGDPRFYSYRRDGARSGRFATLIWSSPSRLRDAE
jgi:YfiH family protein